jgi:hypothetical protein
MIKTIYMKTKKIFKILRCVSLVETGRPVKKSMGQCQRADTSKNKKVTKDFPPASVLVCGLRNQISLKNITQV